MKVVPLPHQRSRTVPAQVTSTLRAALVMQVPAMLEMLGCPAAPLLRRAGMSRPLRNPEARVSYQAVGRLLDECRHATGLPHFGVLMGEDFDPGQALGTVADLMRNSPSVGAALKSLVFHHYINDSGAIPIVFPANSGRVRFGYSIFCSDVPAIDAFYDAALAYGIRILQMLCGPDWNPLRVTFAHRAPDDPAPYHRMFGRNIEFNASINALDIQAELLTRPVVGADVDRYERIRERMRRAQLRQSISLTDQVRRALRPMIFTGTASTANMAEFLSVSGRTLRQSLAAEGTGMRQLHGEARIEIAMQLLRSTDLSVNAISTAAGYSDPPSFIRAFRRRLAGMTPGQWRASHDPDPCDQAD